MNSWDTLDSLQSDLKTYISNNYTGNVKFLYERYPLDLNLQDERSDIPGMRISIYEEPEDVLVRTGGAKAKDFDQAYQIQLFMRVPREGDFDRNVEKELMTVKDHIYDWQDRDSATFDINSITSGELYTFEWNSVNRIVRDRLYSALEINFGAYRGLL